MTPDSTTTPDPSTKDTMTQHPTPTRTPSADQTDRVILRTAQSETSGPGGPRDVIVVDDATGALIAESLDSMSEYEDARVLSWSSSAARTREIAAQFADAIETGRLVVSDGHGPVPLEEFVAGADAHLALARLPKSLAALDDRARRLARAAAAAGREDLELVAGGRVKHMTRHQNDVLAGLFTEVRASLGLGKSRALRASGPRPDVERATPAEGSATVTVRGQERELPLRAVGGVFGGASADAGSLLLLDALDRALKAGELGESGPGAPASEGPEGFCAVDLGSGNGLLTAYLALALPEARVIASDDDIDAVLSTRATADALTGAEDSGASTPTVEVTWDDALSQLPDRSADLVLLNPPFHDGTAIDATLVHGLLDAASRVLRPGGQLWMVHNSHLRYRAELERRVGPARQRARDRRFTVLSAERV